MDYGSPVRLAPVRLVMVFIALTVFAQDPSDTLAKTRDKILSAAPRSRAHACIETIDRSYFSRYNYNPLSSTPSCERLSADRKKGRPKLRLDSTDRLRVQVTLTQGREIYSWTEPGAFSRSVEEILQWGPIGTGAFAANLLDIFADPSVRFRILDEKEQSLEFGFRVPIEASHLIVRAGTEWRAAGYEGSLSIDPRSLELTRFTMESGELPPETTMCEVSTTNEYQGDHSAGLLLPRVSRSHHIMRDSTEAERVTTFSNCHELTASSYAREPDGDLELPERIPFELALTAPIDTASAAAGDIVSARFTKPVLSSKLRVPIGSSTVTGRILRMEHRLVPKEDFVVSIAFDRVQVGGTALRLHARSDGKASLVLTESREVWPQGTFVFVPGRNSRYVIPAGYTSKWWTTAPASPK
jgi:hypothetical protein